MLTTRTPPWISRAALLAGAVTALAIALTGRIHGGGVVPGAELTLDAAPPEGLVVSPAGKAFLRGRMLRPGGPPAAGAVRVRNAADRPLAVQVGVRTGTPDLDALLEVELTAGDRVLARGRLGSVEPEGKAVTLGPGEQRTLRARAWLPRSSRDGWQARSVEASVRFAVRPLGRP